MAKARSKKSQKDEGATIPFRGSFFETFDQIQEKVRRRAYELFEQRDGEEGDATDDWLRAESEVLSDIALDMDEKGDQYVIEGEVPGFDASEIDIHLDDKMLSISGRHHEESEDVSDEEVRSSGVEKNFFRRMAIPGDVDTDRAEARLDGERLHVILPKVSA